MAALTWQQRFPALTDYNFRLWLLSRIFWTLAFYIQSTAGGFLAYELTHSAAFVGSITFAFGLPVLLLSVQAGLLADRFDRRWLVTALQVCWGIPALFLAALTALHRTEPWLLLVWALGLGLIHAVDNPARMAFLPDLVPREDLTNATMLSQMVFYGGMTAAPAIAGVVYARFGPLWCFVLSTLLVLPAVAGYMLMRVAASPQSRQRTSAVRQISEGLKYAVTQPAERSLLILVGLTTAFGVALGVLFPAWAVKIMHGDAATNGMLASARAFGTVLAAAAIALLGRISYKGKLLTIGTFGLPVLWLMFAQVQWLPLSVLVLVGVGAFSTPVVSLTTVLLQILVPDALRGRLMGVNNAVSTGAQTLGSLLVGVLGEALGEVNTVVLAAAVLLATAFAVYLRVPGLRKLE